MIKNLKEIALTSKINDACPDLIPKINAYDTQFDRDTGYHKTKILMEISYCTLSTLAKAVSECGKKFTEDEMMILLYKISDGFC